MDVGCNKEGTSARRFYFCVHCLLSYQQALLRSACLPLLHSLPSGIYTHWWDCPWVFFRTNHPSSLWRSSQEMFQSLNCLCGPELNWTHSSQKIYVNPSIISLPAAFLPDIYIVLFTIPTMPIFKHHHICIHHRALVQSFYPPTECCLPPWGYACPSKYFSTAVQADS